MRISDWSSDVCSSDLLSASQGANTSNQDIDNIAVAMTPAAEPVPAVVFGEAATGTIGRAGGVDRFGFTVTEPTPRSEEHTSELQSLMRISYAVFCLKKKTHSKYITTISPHDNSSIHNPHTSIHITHTRP